MKVLLLTLLAGLSQAHKGHGPHHHHHRHLEEYDEASPAVQELQKELFVASIVASEQCANDVRSLCGAPDVPQIAIEPFSLQDNEDENSISASFVFFRQEGGVRSLASAATSAARRKLFVIMDGGKKVDPEHGHEHEHKHKHGDHEHEHKHGDYEHKHDGHHEHKKRPCHRSGLGQQPVKYGFGSERDQCIHDLVGSDSPDVSDACKQAVSQAETINQELNDEIMMEEMAEQLAGLLFFFSFFLLGLSLLSCALGPHRQKRLLRRSIISAVYSDPDIKAAVEARTGLDLGDVAPIRQTRPQEKCGCGCLIRTLCRGLLAFAATLFALHIFLFFPLALPIACVALGIRACCKSRKAAAYPADAAGEEKSKAVELHEVGVTGEGQPVYVGVPTQVV
jgi:hypothetical protein